MAFLIFFLQRLNCDMIGDPLLALIVIFNSFFFFFFQQRLLNPYGG